MEVVNRKIDLIRTETLIAPPRDGSRIALFLILTVFVAGIDLYRTILFFSIQNGSANVLLS